MNGLKLAAAYSFGPAKLGRCGLKEVHAKLLQEFVLNPAPSAKDASGVRKLLLQLRNATMYYTAIANAHGISDIFNEKVVEAYWIGNELLNRTNWQLPIAVPHHCFFVLKSLFTVKGKIPDELKKKADECRICAGQVVNVKDTTIDVEYQPLLFTGPKICLGLKKKIIRKKFIENPKKGNLVSFHLNWGVEILSPSKAANLKKYTQLSLDAING